MSVISAIAAQRQKLIDGLDANEGEINLRIFEDFYPDEAHFIYELLQNAEDAGATEVSFELFADSCAFEHNGIRQFDEQDIRAITGIFNSSKKDNPDKIGKFGVGFKSVFVYTDTPIIFSKDYSFKILKLVLPEEVPVRPGLGTRTRFEFPFNNAKKNVAASYAEVKSGLEKLSETTLLFLNNLRHIQWKAGERAGEILREEHSDIHIEVLKLVNGDEVVSSHWLRFAEPIQNLEQYTAPTDAAVHQKVAVAFELQLLNDKKSFEKSEPLANQMKIIPAAQGTVSVFFPAEKETSGLRFHLHAPFVPELSRASIKNSPENLPLYSQLAALTAKSLHHIRDAGLLKGEFLAVLPNNDDALPERYRVIRQAVLDEMQQHALVPKHGGGHAPATRLVQSSAALKTLLDAKDLALVTGREDKPAWVIGATQRNSNQDRLLGSLAIPPWDVSHLKHFLEQRLRQPSQPAYSWLTYELNQDVLNWIAAQPFEWLQMLYSMLYKHCNERNDYGELSHVYFVKLTSGKIGTGDQAYFLTGAHSEDDSCHYVDDRVLTAGSKTALQDEAKCFLEKLGVREPNEVDEMTQLLRSRYGKNVGISSNKQYHSDFKRMIAFSEKYPQQRHMFADAFVFRTDAGWATSRHVYLDEPYKKTNLRIVYGSGDSGWRCWPLSAWYLSCEMPLEKIVQFAAWAGCKTEFDNLANEAACRSNPDWSYLSAAPGQRWGKNSLSRDFALSPKGEFLLKAQRMEASLLIWNALCKSETGRSPIRPSILQACYQLTEKGGPRYADSQLVHSLREHAWVPQTDGTFVKPSAAQVDRLPGGFRYDTRYKWLAALHFGAEEKKKATDYAARAVKREELGFQSDEELERAQAFANLPEEEQRSFWNERQRRKEPTELPERPVRNFELRQTRVGEEAKATPGKQSVVRERSVQLGAADAKAEAKRYLVDQYTNSHDEMICQVCKNELPFRLPDGFYYFEAVEVLLDSPKRFREAYLALCPNHAAAFRYANAQRNQMQGIVFMTSDNEIEVELGGELMTIYFTETHLADLKACLATLEEE